VTYAEPFRPPAGAVQGIAAGAASGALSAIVLALPYCMLGPECTVILAPATVAAGPGAAMGAVLGGTNSESKASTLAARSAIAKGLAALEPTKVIASQASELAEIQTAFPIIREASADPKELAMRGVDTVVEISATEFSLVPTLDGLAFFVKAHSRLIRTVDGKVLEEFDTGYGSESRTYRDWGANDAGNLQNALQRAWREIAESIVAEHLLVLHTGGKTLQAQEPAQQRDALQIFAKIKTPGAYTFVDAGSRRPQLRWESLESLLTRATKSTQLAPQQISYELRVYRATSNGYSTVPGNLAYVREGLLEPEHVIEKDLEPCGDYFWTVRAHFVLGKRSRTTKFASLWDSERDFMEFMQHGGTWSFLARSGHYYRFRAGAKEMCKQ